MLPRKLLSRFQAFADIHPLRTLVLSKLYALFSVKIIKTWRYATRYSNSLLTNLNSRDHFHKHHLDPVEFSPARVVQPNAEQCDAFAFTLGSTEVHAAVVDDEHNFQASISDIHVSQVTTDYHRIVATWKFKKQYTASDQVVRRYWTIWSYPFHDCALRTLLVLLQYMLNWSAVIMHVATLSYN